MKEVVSSNTLPDYSLQFDAAGDVVTMWTRDGGAKCKLCLGGKAARQSYTPLVEIPQTVAPPESPTKRRKVDRRVTETYPR
jgi:hypothetical protein